MCFLKIEIVNNCLKELEMTNKAKKQIDYSIFENKIWLTVRDTAHYLSRSENAIYLLIYRKLLKSYKLGSRIYLKRIDIDDLLERSTLLQGGY